MVEDNREVRAFDGDSLVSEWNVFVLVSEAKVRFNADKGHNGHREYPSEDYESIIPTPVLDENAARVDSSDDGEAADYFGNENACE